MLKSPFTGATLNVKVGPASLLVSACVFEPAAFRGRQGRRAMGKRQCCKRGRSPMESSEFASRCKLKRQLHAAKRPKGLDVVGGRKLARWLEGANLRAGEPHCYFSACAGVPSDHLPTGTKKIISGSGTSVNSSLNTTGDPGRFAPQLAPSVFGM